jgi:hypothetical protein
MITIEICDDGKVFIGEENTSGVVYEANTPEEIAEAVQQYLEDYPEA